MPGGLAIRQAGASPGTVSVTPATSGNIESLVGTVREDGILVKFCIGEIRSLQIGAGQVGPS